MGDRITLENVLDKLRLHPPDQTPAVCLIAGQEIARLRADVARLQQQVCDFQAASMLERGGDPGGIKPPDVEREVTRLRADVERKDEAMRKAQVCAEELRLRVQDEREAGLLARLRTIYRIEYIEKLIVAALAPSEITAALADTADKPNEGG